MIRKVFLFAFLVFLPVFAEQDATVVDTTAVPDTAINEKDDGSTIEEKNAVYTKEIEKVEDVINNNNNNNNNKVPPKDNNIKIPKKDDAKTPQNDEVKTPPNNSTKAPQNSEIKAPQKDTTQLNKSEVKKQPIKDNNNKKQNTIKTISYLKRMASIAVQNGQYEVAVDIYKDILTKNKKDTHAKLGLADMYYKLKQYSQAKPIYNQLLKDDPNNLQITLNLLSIMIVESPYEAVYFASNLADKNVKDAPYQAKASVAYSEVQDYQKAILYIKKAIDLEPNNIEYSYNLAVLYDKNGELSLAKDLYTSLLKLKSDDNFSIPVIDIEARLVFINSKL
jgi:tetratricopeptide (TPR) repeat protein